MKRRNFVLTALSVCLIPFRKVFGRNRIERNVIKTEGTTFHRGAFPPHKTIVNGPIKFDMPGFQKTLAEGESIAIIYDKKTARWKVVE